MDVCVNCAPEVEGADEGYTGGPKEIEWLFFTAVIAEQTVCCSWFVCRSVVRLSSLDVSYSKNYSKSSGYIYCGITDYVSG